ncbi:acyltransferase [Streptomyces globosus]|uniref:Acyltransferase n=1 Tax=Streptomyces globosus TaxID=68209 RepID=A0A344U334_9ACTN|nr:acyltransferase [Streptomyces globosus]AXE25305.1 acyltransferase [Streptomyces globosus]
MSTTAEPAATPTERAAEPRQAVHGRLPSLTGLRFIAALLVFCYHSSLALPALNPFASKDIADGYRWLFGNAGWAGVSFFFILSGFVLTWSARPGDPPRHFWRRRFFKIYPNHLVTWVLALALLSGATTQWWQAVPNLFLVHAWIPEFSVFLGVNPPSWSLACELFFYLCFPLFLHGIKRIPPAHLWRWAAGTAAAVVAVPTLAYLLLPGDPPMPEGSPASVWQYWSVYMLPPVRALDFVLGMLMARIVVTGRRFGVRPLPAAAACLAAYALSLYVPWLYALDAVFVIPMALLIPAVALQDVSGRPSPLRGRAAVWLGEVSFAFYMVHLILLNVVREHLLGPDTFFGTAAGIGVLVLEALATLAVAWLLYAAVEKPAMRHLGRTRKAQP